MLKQARNPEKSFEDWISFCVLKPEGSNWRCGNQDVLKGKMCITLEDDKYNKNRGCSSLASDTPSIGLQRFFKWSMENAQCFTGIFWKYFPRILNIKKHIRLNIETIFRQPVSPSVRQSVSPLPLQSFSSSVCQYVSPSVRQPVTLFIGICNFLNRPLVLGLFHPGQVFKSIMRTDE